MLVLGMNNILSFTSSSDDPNCINPGKSKKNLTVFVSSFLQPIGKLGAVICLVTKTCKQNMFVFCSISLGSNSDKDHYFNYWFSTLNRPFFIKLTVDPIKYLVVGTFIFLYNPQSPHSINNCYSISTLISDYQNIIIFIISND